MKLRSILSVAALLLALVLVVSTRPAGAAEQTYTACPTSASAWSYQTGVIYPPYAASVSDDVSPLVGCTGSFEPTTDPMNVVLGYEFAGLPDCGAVTALSVTSTGAPGGAGWAFPVYYADGSTPIVGLPGTDDGGYQQYGAPAGQTIVFPAATFYSPINQPGTGSYSVTYDLDPTGVTIDDLSSGALSASLYAMNVGDIIESITLSATIDDSGCTTTTTTESTTTESTTTTTEATTTTTEAVAAVVTPRFTG